MAAKYGNWIWEGLSTETKPGDSEEFLDGHIFKELDTGESYTRVAGVWEFINLGLSYIKATKSGKITTNASGLYDCVFLTPFINGEYTVNLTCEAVNDNQPPIAFFLNITPTGFTIATKYSRTGNIRANTVVAWLATRNYNP